MPNNSRPDVIDPLVVLFPADADLGVITECAGSRVTLKSTGEAKLREFVMEELVVEEVNQGGSTA